MEATVTVQGQIDDVKAYRKNRHRPKAYVAVYGENKTLLTFSPKEARRTAYKMIAAADRLDEERGD